MADNSLKTPYNNQLYGIQLLENDPITFSLVNAPTGMILDKGVISWQPTTTEIGDSTIDLKVTDTEGAYI